MKFTLLAASAAFVAVPVAAQDAQSPLPIQAVRAAPQPATVLPAGTEIALKMTQEVTTKGNGWEEGDQFNLTVAAPVMLGDFVVIPEGTKAIGRLAATHRPRQREAPWWCTCLSLQTLLLRGRPHASLEHRPSDSAQEVCSIFVPIGGPPSATCTA